MRADLSSTLAGLDYYTPNDYAALDSGGTNICFAPPPGCPPGTRFTVAGDTDMGTGGIVLLSSSQLVSVGKQGIAYVIPYSATSNNTMGGLDGGGYSASSGSDPTATACTTSSNPIPGSIVQCFDAVSFNNNSDVNGIWGSPVFWLAGGSNQYMYGVGLHDYMYWYPYVSGSPSTFNLAAAWRSDHKFARNQDGTGGVGGMAAISWNNTDASTGIAWALDSNQWGRHNQDGSFTPAGAAVLYAYAAIPSGQGQVVSQIWNSSNLSSSMPGAVKFVTPTVTDGYILVVGGVPNYFASGNTACPPPTGSGRFSCAGELTILK